MPKLEPKQIQKELEGGEVWPVYWIYGAEKMKSRELLKRIRATVMNEREEDGGGTGIFALGEEVLDASEIGLAAVVEAALSPALGGGTRLLVVRDAHLFKMTDSDLALLRQIALPKAKAPGLTSVCVFLAKDFDARKKSSKLLEELAAVVPCAEVSEVEREAWVQYLARRRGMELRPADLRRIAAMDPWSLDIADQELEKAALLAADPQGGAPAEALEPQMSLFSNDLLLNSFFCRDRREAMPRAAALSGRPEESLPFLGLLSWNVRQLALYLADPKGLRLSSFLVDQFRRWAPHWTLAEVTQLQGSLAELDFGTKQLPLLPLGLWDDLVARYCK